MGQAKDQKRMKEDFLRYQAQTTPHPLGMVVSKAKGSYIYDAEGKPHLDFVAGVSACTLGHCAPEVVTAIEHQVQQYMHVMVYGEYAQGPAVEYCALLAQHLPEPLESTYLVNSGTEAIEASIKLARRVTGRKKIIGAYEAYHGNTLGSMSLMGMQEQRKPFEPLLADVDFIRFNEFDDLTKIDEHTAGVVVESIQGGAGFIVPLPGYLKALQERCNQLGALLILDEIQPGFGRTGSLFAFQQHDCVPDVLAIGKGMASGLPCGAIVASKNHMDLLSDRPKLGHITTFGGNPVVAAAALATLNVLIQSSLMDEVKSKELSFRQKLKHPLIQEIRGVGLMLALIMPQPEIADYLVLEAAKNQLILFWLLIEKRAVRITPPLTISEQEIALGCHMICSILDRYDPSHVN